MDSFPFARDSRDLVWFSYVALRYEQTLPLERLARVALAATSSTERAIDRELWSSLRRSDIHIVVSGRLHSFMASF